MSAVKVYLGGEGRNELGSRVGHPSYQTDENPGVLQALLSRIQPQGWMVVGATMWCKIRAFRARGPTLDKEERNVLGLAEDACRAQANMVAFVRDADGDEARQSAIERVLTKMPTYFPDLNVVGGAAVPVLEGWLLALLGQPRTEELSKEAAQSNLSARGFGVKDTEAMVGIVQRVDLNRIPQDAATLHRWLSTARTALSNLVGD